MTKHYFINHRRLCEEDYDICMIDEYWPETQEQNWRRLQFMRKYLEGEY